MSARHSPPSSADTALSALRDPDRFVRDSVHAVRASADETIAQATSYARRQPEQALLWALAAGYIMRMLPLVGFLRLLVRIAFGLVKPAVALYGGAKLWERLHAPAAPSKEHQDA